MNRSDELKLKESTAHIRKLVDDGERVIVWVSTEDHEAERKRERELYAHRRLQRERNRYW